MPTPTPPPVHELVRAIAAFGSAQRTFAADVAHDLDLPRASIGLMMHLSRGGPTQVGCLAQHLRVDTSVASRHVTALVDAGLVQRTVSDDDRRARTIELTDAGRTKVQALIERLTSELTTLFGSWDPDELRTASRAITAIATTIGSRSGDPAPALTPATSTGSSPATSTGSTPPARTTIPPGADGVADSPQQTVTKDPA